MAKAWRCTGCSTEYSFIGDELPTPINWSDGHKCTLKEVESKLNKDNE